MSDADNLPRIMVVDDDPTSGMIIDGYLRPHNYDIHFFDNGEKALKAVNEIGPDLIILDIMMPHMSGFEVCEILKNEEATQDIPVLIITALSDPKAHLRAIESGGQGFIVKPFNENLILAYAKTFVRMKRMYDALKQRLASDKDFTSMTIHDLNNLNLAISANLELALLEDDESGGASKYVSDALSVLKGANEMLKKLQAVDHLEAKEKKLNHTQINFIDLTNKAVGLHEAEMKLKDLRFDLRKPDLIKVYGDKGMLLRVLENVIGNAVKFARPATRIDFEIINGKKGTEEREDGGRTKWLEVIVSNQCDPIPEEYHKLIFEKFKQVPSAKRRKPGKGLGLAFCRLAVESHGGRIWLESPLTGKNSGVAVHFTLPASR
ncbi:MAG: hybrid sensor histidine kinase/response regulator [Desulfobacterales bacterium]|nr:hybrid sensor histidine kinase/response regulator [Desulfobacterales bacterium]